MTFSNFNRIDLINMFCGAILMFILIVNFGNEPSAPTIAFYSALGVFFGLGVSEIVKRFSDQD